MYGKQKNKNYNTGSGGTGVRYTEKQEIQYWLWGNWCTVNRKTRNTILALGELMYSKQKNKNYNTGSGGTDVR